MVHPTLSYVIFFVEDPLKSAEFYGNLFNIQPVQSFPTFVLFGLSNGIMLGLWSKKTAVPAVHENAGAAEICLEVSAIDELYDKWLSKKVTVAQEPTNMNFGRTFVVLDPDGHRIRVIEQK